jgi:transposase-like protein
MKTGTYPSTQLQAIRYFADPDVAHDYMVRVRWPNGVICPLCGSANVKFTKTKGEKPRRLWNCHGCNRQFTAKVGTIFEDSPIGFDKWWPAIWMAVNCKNGISSCELARALGVQQKTAWFMLHRIRHALQYGSFEKLSGEIEADETFIGGLSKNMHKNKRKRLGTGGVGKTPVLGLLQREGRVVAKVVPDVQKDTLHAELHRHVEPGSNVFTDKWVAYRGLNRQFRHKTIDHARAYVKGRVHTNSIENFWSLLKRSLSGTYIHVNPEHLPRYVDEQAYRFNERTGSDADRFIIAAQGTAGKRLTYRQLTGKAVSA